MSEDATPEQQIETQAETIKSQWVLIAKLERRNDHAQAHIVKIEGRNKALEFDLSAIGQAEKVFRI